MRANHAKPSRKARKKQLLVFCFVESGLLLAYLDIMGGLHWYTKIDWTSYLATAYLASNIKIFVYTLIFVAITAGIVRLMWFDTPVTKDASDAYDATHDDSRIKPWLKVVDDALTAYANRGRGAAATTIYTDVTAAMDAQDARTRVIDEVRARGAEPNPDAPQSAATGPQRGGNDAD